jgi:hypothetical protein
LSPPATSEIALGLTTLLTWTLARESLKRETYYPSFPVATTEERRQLEALGADLGISFTVVREDSTKRSTEMRPTEDGAVLGRVLYSLGAPIGHKEVHSCLPPAYLYRKACHAERFVATWRQLHAVDGDPESLITIPGRFGEQFVNAVEVLLTEYLGWSTERESEYQLRVLSKDVENA